MIGAVETAIQARLQAAAAAGVLGYRWRTLESYPANWDEYLRDKVPQAPGAWAVFGGAGQAEATSIGSYRLPVKMGVVVMAENLRNETAQRHGGATAAEPGSYQLALDVAGLLNGQDLGLPIDDLRLAGIHFVRTQALVKERKVSMLALEFDTVIGFGSTALAATGEPDPRAIGDFATFHVNWELPGYGVVDADPAAPGAQIPDDAPAAATDHVRLETL